MEKMIEKAMDMCFVIDLDPFRDSDGLRSTFVYRMNALLLYLCMLGDGFYVSVFLLDGPFVETFIKRTESGEHMQLFRQRYFRSLCASQEVCAFHSLQLYETVENTVRDAQNKQPCISYETHSFYITSTPVERCAQDEKTASDHFRTDSDRHLFTLGMDEEDARNTAAKTGCDDFFRYALDDEGLDECFDDLCHTIKAVSGSFSRKIIPMEQNGRAGWYVS